MLPKYLNLLTKWIEFFSLFMVVFGGSLFCFVYWMASTRVGGKYMAAVFELSLPLLTCILRLENEHVADFQLQRQSPLLWCIGL